jgi:hypothetical protein
MTELNLEKMEVFKVRDSDLEQLVQKEYGHNFCFGADAEVRNDSEKLYRDINGKLSESDLREVEEFARDGGYSFLTEAILNDLCRKGKIPAGNYLIYICY